jgi:hypothetical protein
MALSKAASLAVVMTCVSGLVAGRVYCRLARVLREDAFCAGECKGPLKQGFEGVFFRSLLWA